VDGVIAEYFVATVCVVITEAITDAHGNLDGIESVCACVIVPATASDIQFATEEW
jgi:hypothetical protein